jgi:hypothetical protein
VVGIERREKERKRNEKDKNSGTHFWRGFVGPPKNAGLEGKFGGVCKMQAHLEALLELSFYISLQILEQRPI